jgi:hypothetical protein
MIDLCSSIKIRTIGPLFDMRLRANTLPAPSLLHRRVN